MLNSEEVWGRNHQTTEISSLAENENAVAKYKFSKIDDPVNQKDTQ